MDNHHGSTYHVSQNSKKSTKKKKERNEKQLDK